MHILTVTVTNSNDPSCQRLKFTKRFELEDAAIPEPFIRECIKYTEDQFKLVFPRGMSYTIPYTEATVNKVAGADAERLLRQAYASGQLEGTIIGDMLRTYFGVSYTKVEAAPYSDPAAKTVSLGDQHR